MSRWDKLLTKICTLSKDLQFDELRKVLESYGYKMNIPKSIHSESREASQLRYQNMNQSRKYM